MPDGQRRPGAGPSVEAVNTAIRVVHPSADCYARAAVHAAYPVIVAEIVEALRAGNDPDDYVIYMRDALEDAAEFIERKFGGYSP
jgi:hypothetical protein